ncbi:hypothetical protein NB604_06520, partial [Vibrio parahaemolyticus]|uniref:hypothetical protein n=1 Tax=Vibrio parahaemolyticus TaxID=670 RepID=UPI00215C82F6
VLSTKLLNTNKPVKSKIIQHSINLNLIMAILMIEFKEKLSGKLNKKYPHNTGKTERSVSCGFKTIVLLLIRTTNVGMQWKYK